MSQYAEWIAQHVVEDGTGQCAEVTKQMAAAFPELTRVRGHYYCDRWGERTHWWLVTADGTIVDPTAQQFPSKGTGTYVPWVEGEEEPTGTCLNCGQPAYRQRNFCSDACDAVTTAEFNRGLRR